MDNYWETIIENLSSFCKPGDQIFCKYIFKEDGQVCDLCGHSPITWNHVLINKRTGDEMIVGSNCVHNFKEGLKRLHFDLEITYPNKYEKIANRINEKYPGTVVIDEYGHEVEEDYPEEIYQLEFGMERLSGDELAPEGMGSDEIDWDSFDFDDD